MKVITIGRDESCDIVLDDGMISRRQAVLRLYPSGRIEIIDYSRNGTMVNGVRLGTEKLTRITRKDAISFAGVKTLDWDTVPDPSRPVRMGIIAGAAVIVVGLLLWGGISLYHHLSDDEVQVTPVENVTTAPAAPGAGADNAGTDNPGADNPADGQSVKEDKDLNKPLPKTDPNAPRHPKKGPKKDPIKPKVEPKPEPKPEPEPTPDPGKGSKRRF